MTIEVCERAVRLGHYAGMLGWTEYEVAYSAHVPMTDTIADLAMVVDAEEHRRRMLSNASAIGDDPHATVVAADRADRQTAAMALPPLTQHRGCARSRSGEVLWDGPEQPTRRGNSRD
jgi:hypothetical protein